MPRKPAAASPAPVPPPALDPPTEPVLQRVHDPETMWLPMSEVTRWAKNPRINTAAIPRVAESLRRFGFVAPAVVWKEADRLVAGHTRMAALAHILATEPGFIPRHAPPGVRPGMLPVRFHPFASEAEADAYGIADNRLNELAEWDTGLLQGLLQGMDTTLADVTGFDLGALVIPELDTASTDTPTSPPAGTDPGAAGPNRESPVIHYDLVFTTEAEQDAWTAALKALRQKWPQEPTHAARVLRVLREAGLGVTA